VGNFVKTQWNLEQDDGLTKYLQYRINSVYETIQPSLASAYQTVQQQPWVQTAESDFNKVAPDLSFLYSAYYPAAQPRHS
jgi:hypothetical protein